MKSYVNVPLSVFRRIRELSALYAFRRSAEAQEVEQLIKGVQEHASV